MFFLPLPANSSNILLI